MKILRVFTHILLLAACAQGFSREMRIYAADHNTGKVNKIREDGTL
jgi:hypothetical protein